MSSTVSNSLNRNSPPIRFIQTDAQKTESVASGGSVNTRYGSHGAATGESVTKPLLVTDVVAMYPDTKADYIVVTYSSDKQVRIIKKADSSLVAAGDCARDNLEFSDFVFSLFANAGLVGKELGEKRCKSVIRKAR